jgi:RNA polymerase primary sigma factor
MELSLETLGQLQDLILDLKADVAVGLPNKPEGYFARLKSEVKIVKRNTDYGEDHQVLSKFSQAEELKSVLNELQVVIERIQDIQQHLVKSNLLLVASIVKQFAFNEFPLSFLDLMQEGSIGLMKAIHKFRLEKGYRFSTYATWWISQAIRRALDEQSQLIRIPIYVTEMRRRAAKASSDLMKRLGREPKMSELAEEVNIKDSRLRNLLQAPKDLLSLDSPIGGLDDDRTTVADLIKDKVTMSPEEEMLSKAREEILQHILSTLTPQQERVIKLRYGLFDGECHTLAQIGKQLKITRERVRQIEAEALNKLRHPNRQHYWKELFD